MQAIAQLILKMADLQKAAIQEAANKKAQGMFLAGGLRAGFSVIILLYAAQLQKNCRASAHELIRGVM